MPRAKPKGRRWDPAQLIYSRYARRAKLSAAQICELVAWCRLDPGKVERVGQLRLKVELALGWGYGNLYGLLDGAPTPAAISAALRQVRDSSSRLSKAIGSSGRLMEVLVDLDRWSRNLLLEHDSARPEKVADLEDLLTLLGRVHEAAKQALAFLESAKVESRGAPGRQALRITAQHLAEIFDEFAASRMRGKARETNRLDFVQAALKAGGMPSLGETALGKLFGARDTAR